MGWIRFETLEPRQLFAAVQPSNQEQYLIELINRARSDPFTEAARLGIDANEGLAPGTVAVASRQPLAPNLFLTDSAEQHSTFLLTSLLTNPILPKDEPAITPFDPDDRNADGFLDPAERMIKAGFFFSNASQSAESLADVVPGAPMLNQAAVDAVYAALFSDTATIDRSDRLNILNSAFKEIGAGLDNNPTATTATVDLAASLGLDGGDSFLTGVAYDDGNGIGSDNFYSPGEGLRNITITARRLSDNIIFTTQTYNSGGYSLRLAPGQYDVIASGPGIGSNLVVRYQSVVIGDTNQKRDFRPDFAVPAPPITGSYIPPDQAPGVIETGAIHGSLYLDRNGDGKRDNQQPGDELALPGYQIYVDYNNNSTLDSNEPFGLSLSNGSYRVTGLHSGLYHIRVVPPAGFRVSVPDTGERLVTLNARKDVRIKAFAVTDRTLISGIVFRDDNGDGIKQDEERRLSRWRVFLDLNGDGVWQPDIETSRKSDKHGEYAFKDLLPGTYTVRIVPQVGYTQTAPPGGSFTISLPTAGQIAVNNLFGLRKFL